MSLRPFWVISPTEPSAAGLPLLIRIRWLAVPGQLAVSWLLPLTGDGSAALLIPLGVALSNLVAWRIGRFSPSRVAGALIVLDSGLLTLWLAFTGGSINPFTLLYLTLIALAALVLSPLWTLAIAALTSLEFALLLFSAPTGGLHADHGMALTHHVQGMFVAFLMAAVLTAVFAAGLRRELDRRENELARERAERSRAERLAALSTMIGSAAHELSTPVATLALAGAEIGRRLTEEDSELAREMAPELEALRHESARCRQILDGLAERSGDPRGEAPRRVALAELLAGAAAELTEEERVRLKVAPGPPLEVLVPRRALKGALGALLRNAFDASPPGAEVEAELTAAAGSQALLRILDRGSGLPAEALEQAFEPFYTTKERGRGLGLGLFMARSLVSHLGGELRLENRPEGGAAASLLLPLAGGGAAA